MDWMDHCLVFDPDTSAPVGLAKKSQPGSTNVFMSWDKWLYASYCEFSKASNNNMLGRSRFETLLMDVCVHQLRLNIYKFKDTRGMRVKNISCRASDPKYSDYPSIINVGLNKERWRGEYGDVLDKKEKQEG